MFPACRTVQQPGSLSRTFTSTSCPGELGTLSATTRCTTPLRPVPSRKLLTGDLSHKSHLQSSHMQPSSAAITGFQHRQWNCGNLARPPTLPAGAALCMLLTNAFPACEITSRKSSRQCHWARTPSKLFLFSEEAINAFVFLLSLVCFPIDGQVLGRSAPAQHLAQHLVY